MVLRWLAILAAGFLLIGCDKAPSIPHAITAQTDSYCLSCHKGGGAPRTPHADRADCTSCHTPQ